MSAKVGCGESSAADLASFLALAAHRSRKRVVDAKGHVGNMYWTDGNRVLHRKESEKAIRDIASAINN